MTRPTVLLGMSGGVDSSVAAMLLVEQGYQVQGVTLQVWEPEDPDTAPSKRWQERGCCKVGLARYVAQRLAIPHEVVDARAAFRTAVIDDFLAGYQAGLTPNPCVRCNERVKIRALAQLAEDRGLDFVATGHYARVVPGAPPTLRRARDARKDQTYFLYRLAPGWLSRLRFPVGELLKAEVWERAAALGLPADELKESQEICFVSQGDYRTFIEREAPEARRPGPLVDQEGRVLGQHPGIAFFTPGQRRGLGVAAGQRLYVQRVIPESATVVLGPEEHLYRTDCQVADLNLLDPALAAQPMRAHVKIRYASPAAPATLVPDAADGTITVRFDEPQRALSPGQSAVFYEADRVLGGGIIQ